MRIRIVAVALASMLASIFSTPAAAFFFWCPSIFAPLTTEVKNVLVRPGVNVRYLAIHRTGSTPENAVILFAGGDGLLSLSSSGAIGTGLALNFLVRSREKFACAGLYTVVVDTPGAVAINGNIRLSEQYAQDMAKVIARVREDPPLRRIWLVGTSSGTLSAAGIAARRPLIPLHPPSKINYGRPEGIVLTSTQSTLVSGLCGRTVFDATLSRVNVPAYVVAHQDDGCACSPAAAVPSVLAALTRSPVKENIEFVGGSPPISTDPCQAQTPHGYLGIENSVVNNIASWIKTH
ncbi:MAG TPA: hypothetical protein VIG34_04605 [Xanthobacteraceae bacterium]|jgi:hypothetical protein